jgi:PAS domain S-box-containing protein
MTLRNPAARPGTSASTGAGENNELRLAADLAGMRRLYDLQAKLARETELSSALDEIVAAAVDLAGTDRGCVQLVSEDGTRLEIVAQRGYADDGPFISRFRHQGAVVACNAVRRQHVRFVTEDVASHPGFIGTADGEAASADGIRAAQSTPLISRSGQMVGVLSTQYRAPYSPSEHELRLIDMLGWAAADFIDRHRTEAALERVTQARHAFLLRLTDEVRQLSDPQAIMAAADDALAAELGVMRVGHLEMRDGGETFVTHHECQQDGQAPAVELHRLSEGGAWLADALRHGRTAAVADVAADPRTADAAQMHARFGTRALIAVPLRRNGKLQAVVHVEDQRPREWTPAEVALVEEVAVRTWTAVERARAEAALRASEARFRTALEIETVGAIYFDMTGKLTDANDAFLRMSGYDREDLEAGRLTWQNLTPPEWIEGSMRAFAELKAFGQTTPYEKEYLRQDGKRWWALFAAKLLPDGTGFEFVLDITDRKLVEAERVSAAIERARITAELRKSESRLQVLVHELQHRTRNLMGVVRSTVGKTLKTSSDLADFESRFQSRIDALARVQGLLSRLDEHDRVTFGELVRTELDAMGATEDVIRLDGPPDVRLRSGAVQTLAMALHELATNALKYGALQQPGAHLSIRWRLEPHGDGGKPWLHVEWRETGVTMPQPGSAPLRRGQGRDLIERALPYQLKARTSFELGANGVCCTIALPVSTTNEGRATDA